MVNSTAYADRFVSILAQALEDFEELNPSTEARRKILDDLVYSMSAVYTVAAEPNPQTALLDMVTITTLGRMIYEDNMRRRYGQQTVVVANGFQQLEKDNRTGHRY